MSSDPVATGSAFAKLRERIFNDAIIYALARAISNAASFALVVLLSRTLVPSELGLYSVLLGAVGLSSVVWFSWFSSAAFRYSAEYRVAGTLWRMRATAVRVYAVLGVAIGGVAALAWVLGVPWIGDLPAPIAMFWVVLLAMSAPASALPDLYRAEGLPGPSAVLTIAVAAVPIGGILVFAAMSSVDLVVVLGMQALVCLTVFTIVGMSWGSRPAFPTAEARDMLRRFFRYGWPLVASGVSAWMLSLADRYIIALVATAEQVGYYTVGYQIASAPLLFVYYAIALPFEPLAFSAHAAGERTRALELVRKGIGLTLAAETIACILLIGAREEIIGSFIGDVYARAVDVIPLIALGTAIFTVALARQQSAVLAEDTRAMLRALLTAAVFNIALNFVLVPVLSIEGAALATTLGYTLYAGFMFLRRDLRGMPLPEGWFLQILVAGALAVALFALVDRIGPEGWGGYALSAAASLVGYLGALSARGSDSVLRAMREMLTRR